MDTNETGNKYFLPAAVVVAGLLIAGAVVWNGQRPPQAGPGAAPTADIKDIDISGDPFIGEASAPVTIAVWSDYQCPFCKKFEVETLPSIIADYVDAGKVKVVFMDFVFLGNDSVDAAVYGRAVWKLYPEQYFAWRTAMYEAQDEEGDQGFGDASSIDALTAKIPGIDAAKVAADVKANRDGYKAAADADRAEGQKIGINATPSFVINTQIIQGAYPYPAFQEAIDAALK